MSEIKKVESDDLKIIKVDHVKNLLNAGPILEKVIKDNPFIEPTDETIDTAEKARIALKNGRTTINRHEKDIASGLSKARKAIKTKADELRLIVESAEQKQKEANNAYFDNKAWKDALETNTKEVYLSYCHDFEHYTKEALEKIQEIETAEAQAVKVYETWKTDINEKIILVNDLDSVEVITQQLDNSDLEDFIDPDAAFNARENFYSLLDAKKTSIEKAEAERIERERIAKEFKEKADAELIERKKQAAELQKKIDANREEARLYDLKLKKERETLRLENEKKAEEAKILKQLENYNNTVETFELIAMSIPGINEVEQLNIYSGKIEGIIEKDFGDNETDIKNRYETFIIILNDRRNILNTEIQKQKAIDAQKLQEEQNEIEEQPKIVTYEPAPSSPNYEKIEQEKKAEAERLKDEEYKEDKNQALEPICDGLATIYVEHENDIKKFNLKDDIIKYISDLLI